MSLLCIYQNIITKLEILGKFNSDGANMSPESKMKKKMILHVILDRIPVYYYSE